MAEPFIGQIQAFGFNFAPRGWAECNGQLLEINRHSALFSLLGTQYGGDGRTTFGLPDLQGRSMVHQGRGSGLNPTQMGQKGGNQTNTLTERNLPAHNHTIRLSNKPGDGHTGVGCGLAQRALNTQTGQPNELLEIFRASPGFDKGKTLHSDTVAHAGGGQSFSIQSPYTVVNICIALEGTFPSRS